MAFGTAEGLRREQQERQEAQPANAVDVDRESIWTIPARLKRSYFALFSVQIVIAFVWLTSATATDETKGGVQDVLFHVWQHLAPAAVTSAAITLVLVDTANGIMVLSTWLQETLEKRRERERQREEERHRQEMEAAVAAASAAVDKARVEARAQVHQVWLEWNRRREAAAAAGEEFKEPPPDITPDNDVQ